MTTSEQPGVPAEGSPPGPDDTTGDEVMRLQQEIEQTREHLGETVGQLAAKADVRNMAASKASEVSERMKSKADQMRQQAASTAGNVRGQLAGKAGQARQQAATTADSVRGQLADKTTTVRQKAQSAGQSGKDQIVAAAAPVWDAAPDPVRQAVTKGASSAKERRVPIAVAIGAIIVLLVVLRRWRGR
jgi:cobalamin biosynthesis Mg chelatase CobN